MLVSPMGLSAPTKTQRPGAVPSDLTGSTWTWPEQPASDGEGRPHAPIAHSRHGMGTALGLARPQTPHSTQSSPLPSPAMTLSARKEATVHPAPRPRPHCSPGLQGPGSGLAALPAPHRPHQRLALPTLSLTCTAAAPTPHLDTTRSSPGIPRVPAGASLVGRTAPHAAQARNSAPCLTFPSLQPRGRTADVHTTKRGPSGQNLPSGQDPRTPSSRIPEGTTERVARLTQ